MILRTYQRNAVESVGQLNAIIKMPTGSGKTFVAAELIKRKLSAENPSSVQCFALFLVPTCDLVEQQSKAIQSWFHCNVATYMGGAEVPTACSQFRVLVSTPQSFFILQSQNIRFHWKEICICVFDEVHHVLKNHPYRKIALSLKKNNTDVQIIGLSASLTYAVGEKGVTNTLNRLGRELGIEKMVSPSEEDLLAGGYVPQKENIEIDSYRDTPEGVVPEVERKPHLMHSTFFTRVKNAKMTDFSKMIYDIIQCLEEQAKQCEKNFASPLMSVKLTSWEEYAHKLAKANLIKCPVNCIFFKMLEIWYVALRLLIQSWEENEQLVLLWLKSQNGFVVEDHWIPKLGSRIKYVERLSLNDYNLMKVGALREHLRTKMNRFGKRFCGIVFVQQRITAHILSYYLNQDQDLRDLGLRTGYVTARGTHITPSIKVTASSAKSEIDKFRKGELNLIIATSVIEEGFDVPSANVVISFDHLKDSVELCQRFGRARQGESAIVVMDERRDRPIEMLKRVKRQQDNMISAYNPNAVPKDNGAAAKIAQKNREVSASKVLFDRNKCNTSPLGSLNEFLQKTKSSLVENFDKLNGVFQCKLKYESNITCVVAVGIGESKKKAKTQSALNLLEKLRKCVS